MEVYATGDLVGHLWRRGLRNPSPVTTSARDSRLPAGGRVTETSGPNAHAHSALSVGIPRCPVDFELGFLTLDKIAERKRAESVSSATSCAPGATTAADPALGRLSAHERTRGTGCEDEI